MEADRWYILDGADNPVPAADLGGPLPAEGRGQGFESLRARQITPAPAPVSAEATNGDGGGVRSLFANFR